MTERDDSSDDDRRSDANNEESDDERPDEHGDAADDDRDGERRSEAGNHERLRIRSGDERRDEKPWHKNPYVLLGGALLIGIAFALLTWRKPMDAAPTSAPERLASATPPATNTGARNVIQGRVLESLQVSRYTYLRIATERAGEVWAAVPATQVATGTDVRIRNPQRMEKFTSHTLKRAFEVIYFGVLDGAPGSASGPGSPHGHGAMGGSSASPHGSPAVSVELPSEPITRASGPNGRTIQQVHAQKKTLSGKTVRVQGVVVRATANVMGKTWVHLRDGSGSASDKSNDLTVTMQSQPTVGQVIQVEGKLGIDRDFGSGYRYGALLEDARLIQEGAE